MAVLLAGGRGGQTYAARVDDELDSFETTLMKHEEAIGACMRAEGFDYIAALPADWYLERAYQQDVARGGDGQVDIDVPDNPNDVIVAALSADEQQAYQEADWGNIETGGDDEGCYYSTYREVWGPNLFTDVSDAEADDVLAVIDSDPRILAAETDFMKCMRAEGFEVSTIDGVFMLLDQAYANLMDNAGPDFDGDITQLAGYAAYENLRIEAVTAYETCEVGFYEVYDTVQQEYTTDLLEDS